MLTLRHCSWTYLDVPEQRHGLISRFDPSPAESQILHVGPFAEESVSDLAYDSTLVELGHALMKDGGSVLAVTWPPLCTSL